MKEFTTKEVEPGVYRANVTFPTSGVWRYEVIDGYLQQVHTYPPLKVTGNPATTLSVPSDPDGGIAAGWLWAAGAALLLALGVLAFDRRRRHAAGATPEPA
jgi:hypothetical protein